MLSLLKASLVSSTPLSDLILNKTGKTNSVTVESEPKRLIETEVQENPNSKKMSLKAMVQKSSGKLLYAQAEEDFVEFLFSFFNIPVGAAEHLAGGKTGIKAIDNLYRSMIDLIDDKYFKSPDTKKRLIKPNLPHGCNSKDYILPLTEERLPPAYSDLSMFSCVKFPKGQGRYLDGPTAYLVTDDLVVTPFCFISSLSSLRELKVPISDVKEVELEIGTKEVIQLFNVCVEYDDVLCICLDVDRKCFFGAGFEHTENLFYIHICPH